MKIFKEKRSRQEVNEMLCLMYASQLTQLDSYTGNNVKQVNEMSKNKNNVV